MNQINIYGNSFEILDKVKNDLKNYVNVAFKKYYSKWKFDFTKEISLHLFGPNDEQIEIEYLGIRKIEISKDNDYGILEIKTSHVLINIDFKKINNKIKTLQKALQL